MIGDLHEIYFGYEADCGDEYDAVMLSADWTCPICRFGNTIQTVYYDIENSTLNIDSSGALLPGSKFHCDLCRARFEIQQPEKLSFMTTVRHIDADCRKRAA